jgi:urease accessory protein UreE
VNIRHDWALYTGNRLAVAGPFPGWTALRWRQDHLPVGRLRRPSDREALLHLERDEAWRVADRLALDDDQRFSLISHHASEVGGRVERAPRTISSYRGAP